MQCPKHHQLPAPPDGKTGWPWTEETPPPEPHEQCDFPWPWVILYK